MHEHASLVSTNVFVSSPANPHPLLILFIHTQVPQHLESRLSARAPDVLEVTVPLRKAVQAVVALAHGADETAQSIHLVLASVAAVLVDLGDGELH